MDIAVEPVPPPQDLRGGDHPLHDPVCPSGDARAQEEPARLARLVEGNEEPGQLLRGEALAPHVPADPVLAILAILGADIGLQDLEQPDRPAVRECGRVDPTVIHGTLPAARRCESRHRRDRSAPIRPTGSSSPARPGSFPAVFVLSYSLNPRMAMVQRGRHQASRVVWAGRIPALPLTGVD